MSGKLLGLEGLKVHADKPARLTVVNPYTRAPLTVTDTDIVCWVDVLSDSSAVGAALVREQTDKIFQRRGRPIKPEDFEKDQVEKAARLTVNWGLVSLSGDAIDLPYTRSTARDVYAMPELRWLRDQVLDFSAELGNFQETS